MQLEAFGQGEGHRGLGIEVVDRGLVGVGGAHHVDLARVARGGADATCIAQCFVEGEAAVAEGLGDGAQYFAEHKHFGIFAADDAHQVTAGQQNLRGVDALGGQLRQAHVGGDAVAGDGDGGAVGQGAVAPCPANGFGQGERDVVDGLQAGTADFAVDVDAATAVGLDAQSDLGVFDDFGQLLGDQVTRLVFGQACELDVADVGELDLAVRADVVAVANGCHGRSAVTAHGGHSARRGDGQFRVVPDDDVEDVATADGVGLGCAKEFFDLGGDVVFAAGALLAQQFGCDTLQGTRWHGIGVFGIGFETVAGVKAR